MNKYKHELPDGQVVHRGLGLKKREGSKAKARAFVIPVIDQENWKPIISPQPTVPILDQGQRGSCVGHGCATMVMKARDLANIDSKFNLLSPMFLYDQINGGVDNGSDPADAVNVLQSIGICLEQTVPDRSSTTLNKNKLPPVAYTEAKRFILPQGSVYQLTNFNQLVTAFLLGFKAGFTINVGNTFDLDNNGIVTYTPGNANHWVSVGEELKKVNPSGEWALQFDNSWTTSWGNNGRAFITVKHIDNQPGVEMYAIKSVSDDPMNPI